MTTRTSSARVELPASRKEAPKGATLVGKTSPNQRVEITVRIRRKPGAGTPTPRSIPLTRDQFRAAYGADPVDIERIEKFANEHGLDVVQTSVAQRAVRLSGTAAAMQAAFGVRFKNYRPVKAKQAFRGRTGSISIPKDLAPVIEVSSVWTIAPRRVPTSIFARSKGRFEPGPIRVGR